MFVIFGQDWRWFGGSPEPSPDGGGRLGIYKEKQKTALKSSTSHFF